jgi:hypothetical protein
VKPSIAAVGESPCAAFRKSIFQRTAASRHKLPFLSRSFLRADKPR